MAAYYPDEPDVGQRQHATNFIHALAALYPCTHCAAALRKWIVKDPPAVESREALSLWMCRTHNDVNRDLGLPVVPCHLASLDQRWRTGRQDCFLARESSSTAAAAAAVVATGGGDGDRHAESAAHSLGHES
jgi:hypothetical protein